MNFLALVRLEFLLLLRSHGLGLYAAVTALVLAANLVFSSVDMAGMVESLTTSLLVVELPVLALTMAPVLTRDWTRGGDVLRIAPMGFLPPAAARLVAALLAVSGVLVAIFAVAGIAFGSRSEYPWPNGFLIGRALCRLILPVTWAQVALIHALCNVLRRVAWVALPCMLLTLATALGAYIFTQHLLHPLNYGWLTLTFDATVGLGADGPIQSRMTLMFLAVGLGLWLLSLPTIRLQDSRADWRQGQSSFVLGLAATGLGMIALCPGLYVQTYRSHIVPRMQTVQINTWQVDEAAHEIEWQRGNLAATSRLLMRPAKTETGSLGAVDLILNPGLRVQAAKLNGVSAVTERRGEVVSLSWPNGEPLSSVPVEIEMEYAGSPRLLREDYGETSSLPRPVPRFRRKTVSYGDVDNLFLVRDSDWLVWPLSPYPKRSRENHGIVVTVGDTSAPLFSTANQVSLQPDSSTAVHRWSGLAPALLMWAAPQRTLEVPGGRLRIGRLQNDHEIEAAQEILGWAHRLQEIPGKEAEELELLVMPYGDRVQFAWPYVGVPEERIQWQVLWHLSLADEHEEETIRFQVRLNEAIQFTADWLFEWVPWEAHPMTFDGRTYYHNDGQTPRRNPQAPFQRWTAHPVPAVWHYAFAVVVAQRLLMTEEAEFVGRERFLWKQISEVKGEIRGSVAHLENDFKLLTLPTGLREYGEDDTCELAAAVMELHAFADTYGDASLWHWLGELHAFQGDDNDPGVVNESVIKQVGTALAESPRKTAEVPCHKYLH